MIPTTKLAKYFFTCFITCMKITQTTNTNPTFGYGITRQIAKEIQRCDIAKIQKEFRKNNIPTDFQGEKFFAYCSLKCLNLIKHLNSMYKLNLGLPKGVFVKDFVKIGDELEDAFGATATVPTTAYENDNTIYPIGTVFFDKREHYTMNEYDIMSDMLYESGDQPSPFFLHLTLHEFAHAAHIDHLLNNFNVKEYVKKLISDDIPNEYIPLIKNHVCEYATTDVFEAVACDMSKRIVEYIDEKALIPTSNPFKHGPYKKYNLFEKLSKKDELDKIMHKFWLGKF